ncbi:hypothetical protein AGLY_001224 [Aphis glycines]|uniref:Uncharacterized protein n=1 Tax=Aphis glycines TaxID=307491 RepID=A0A6G0U974_APHGL|nr:hypothetical protein AGLY_001224 [Aphis glycines]
MFGDDQVKRRGSVIEQVPDGRHVEQTFCCLGHVVQTDHYLQRFDDAKVPGIVRHSNVVVGHGHGTGDTDVGNFRVRRCEIADYVHVVSAVCQSPQVRHEHHVMAVPLVREHSEYASRGRAVRSGHGGSDEQILIHCGDVNHGGMMCIPPVSFTAATVGDTPFKDQCVLTNTRLTLDANSSRDTSRPKRFLSVRWLQGRFTSRNMAADTTDTAVLVSRWPRSMCSNRPLNTDGLYAICCG